MTLRQWYKGMALAAAGELSAQANQAGMHPKKTADLLAKAVGDIADAMIAEDERAIQEDVDA